MNFKELISHGENKRVEFKEQLPKNESIGKRPITTNYDRIVLEYLQGNRRISRKEATTILELGETKIKELFNELIDRGFIQHVGAGRSTYYVLNLEKN